VSIESEMLFKYTSCFSNSSTSSIECCSDRPNRSSLYTITVSPPASEKAA
jgi:hypothetical protein